jgi:putative oxidoreductase
MNTVLWILQLLLAAAFLAFGGMKLGLSDAALAAKLGWVASVPSWLPRFIGVAEVLGAIGLVLPAATRIAPWFTPLASASLASITLLAVVVHFARNEGALGTPAAVLFLLCTVLTAGRWWLVPITARPSP